jgi:hypothetical protein
MRIKAIVEIKLNMDGSWELISLDTPPESTPETKKIRVIDHFRNLNRVREERITNAKGNDSPKTCGICGKIHHLPLTHEVHKNG